MVDYSRFDKIADEMSDDEENQKPRVTRLDKQSSITFGGGKDVTINTPYDPTPARHTPINTISTTFSSGSSSSSAVPRPVVVKTTKPRSKPKGVVDYAKWDQMAAEMSESDDDADDDFDDAEFIDAVDGGEPGHGRADPFSSAAAAMDAEGSPIHMAQDRSARGGAGGGGVKAKPAPTAAAPTAAAPAGAAREAKYGGPTADDMTLNGSTTATHMWSQDEREVRLCIYVASGTRAKQISVDVRKGVALDHIAVQVSGVAVLDSDLTYPIELPENDDDEDGFTDWEVMDHPSGAETRRLVVVTLAKKVVGGGAVVVWWKRALPSDAEIDVSKVKGRVKQKDRDAVASAWKEAHQMFKDKAKSRQPMQV